MEKSATPFKFMKSAMNLRKIVPSSGEKGLSVFLSSSLERAAQSFIVREFDLSARWQSAAESGYFLRILFKFFGKNSCIQIADGTRIKAQNNFLHFTVETNRRWRGDKRLQSLKPHPL